MKMMKTLLAIGLAACMLAAPVPARAAVVAAPDLFYTYNGLLQKTTVPPVVVDGVVCVSFRELSDILGATLTWDGATKTSTMVAGGRRAETQVGSKKMVINYRNVEAPVAPVLVNGRVMVPLLFMCAQWDLKIDWGAGSPIARLTDNKAQYSVYHTIREKKKPAKAQEMTLKQAVDKAAAQNAAIKDAKDSLTLLERRKRDLDDDIAKYIIEPQMTLKGPLTSEEVEMFRLQMKLGNQIKAIGLNEKAARDGAEARVVNALIDIEKTDADIYLLEEKITLGEEGLAQTKLRQSVGMASANAVTSAEAAINRDKASLEALNVRQAGNRLSLTNLLGLKAGTVVSVTDFDAKDAAYNADLEGYIAGLLKTAPSVTMKSMDLDYAKFEQYSYDYLLDPDLHQKEHKDGEKPEIEVELLNKVQSASRAYEDAKTAVDKSARSAMQTIRQLEQNKQTLALDEDNARSTYDTAVVNYVAGYATYYDVQQAQFALFSAEAANVTYDLNMRAAVEGYRKAYLQQ